MPDTPENPERTENSSEARKNEPSNDAPPVDPRDDLTNEDVMTRVAAGERPELLPKLREILKKHGWGEERIDTYCATQKLRRVAHQQSDKDLIDRLSSNQEPTATELSLGTFLEAIEPQVRDAVRLMHEKGYSPYHSGFGSGEDQDVYFTDPDLKALDASTKAKLEEMGVTVTDDEIAFQVGTRNMDELKDMWGRVVEILPDLNRQAPPSKTRAADMFRKKYGADV